MILSNSQVIIASVDSKEDENNISFNEKLNQEFCSDSNVIIISDLSNLIQNFCKKDLSIYLTLNQVFNSNKMITSELSKLIYNFCEKDLSPYLTKKLSEISDQNNLKIIMTGISDLRDLDNNNIEHYKNIIIESSLKDKNYQVFGSIIFKNNVKLEDFCVNFSSYEFNGFSAI